MAEISAPNAGAYGIWGPAYAQALAGQTGSAGAGPLNMLALRSYMGQEQGGYGEALAATQQAQLQAARIAAEAEKAKAALGVIPSGIQFGGTEYLDPILRQFGLLPDANAGAVRDTAVLEDLAAGAFKDRSAGTAAVANVGFAPPASDINNLLMPPDPTAPLPEFMPYMTPKETSDRISANANTVSAQASMVNANRPRAAGGSGGSTSYVITPSAIPGQPPQVSIRTKDQTVLDQYAAPAPRGGNSVERSGGAKSAADRLAELLNSQ